MDFEDYKFKYVYRFADLIYSMVESGTEFWAYNEELLRDATLKFNKTTALHIYIYTQLLNYYNREYRKSGDCYEEDAYDEWVNIAEAYGLEFKSEYNPESSDNPFYDWYQANGEIFEDLFDYITDEVFFCLFSNHPFLVLFNKLLADLIHNEDGQRDWSYPDGSIEENGTIKRCNIPQWAKDAVFHRDHGKCVFCGKDLTSVYTHSNKVNYDHIVPLNKYGANDPCNLQTTCEHCNKSKQDKEDNPQYKYEPWW